MGFAEQHTRGLPQHGWLSVLVLLLPQAMAVNLQLHLQLTPSCAALPNRGYLRQPWARISAGVTAHCTKCAQYSSSESETSSPRARRASLSFLAFFFSLLFSVFFCCFTFTTLPATPQQHFSAQALKLQIIGTTSRHHICACAGCCAQQNAARSAPRSPLA